ncbi:MAG: crossover junction endodeoxyribonuclease RuvC [Treponema sp.]|nr:crossover junction endodeoxyribonuclease RuvC [Treponema sp.]
MQNSNLQFNSLPGTQCKKSSRKLKVRRVLGIDPGLANTGFGVVDSCGGKYRMVSYGVIETSSSQSLGERLLTIYSRLQAVIDEFRPDEACMEALFFARNVTSAISVAEAKGVVTLCLAQNALPISEYKPNQIKKAVTGTASADKELVEKYVQLLLNLEVKPEPDHAADALAGAVCHLHNCFEKQGF